MNELEIKKKDKLICVNIGEVIVRDIYISITNQSRCFDVWNKEKKLLCLVTANLLSPIK